MNAKTEEIGPERISFATFLLRLIAGAAGGVAGGLLLLLMFILVSSVFEPIASLGEELSYISPIFTFILLMMIFISATVGNIAAVWLMGLVEREKYQKIPSTIYQIFVISLIIFLLLAPVYFITGTTDPAITAYVVALHVVISAQASALIMEIISNYRYSLVGVYGVTFSILVSAGVLFSLAGLIASPQILLFVALPAVWGTIALVGAVVNNIYSWLAKTYDKDFLAADTLYGEDYGEEVEEEEEEKAEDREGGDFLRQN